MLSSAWESGRYSVSAAFNTWDANDIYGCKPNAIVIQIDNSADLGLILCTVTGSIGFCITTGHDTRVRATDFVFITFA